MCFLNYLLTQSLKSKNGQGGNSQNFLGQIRKIFVTFRCFYKAIIRRK